jgi:hypothetical protein
MTPTTPTKRQEQVDDDDLQGAIAECAIRVQENRAITLQMWESFLAIKELVRKQEGGIEEELLVVCQDDHREDSDLKPQSEPVSLYSFAFLAC